MTQAWREEAQLGIGPHWIDCRVVGGGPLLFLCHCDRLDRVMLLQSIVRIEIVGECRCLSLYKGHPALPGPLSSQQAVLGIQALELQSS